MMKLTTFKKITFQATTLAIVTLSSHAFAANLLCCARQTLATYTVDTPHWYGSANFGWSHLYDKPVPGSNNSVNQNGPGWNVNGGYQFNSIFGAELGYTNYFHSRETSGITTVATTDHYAVDLAATGRLPLACKFNALGKLGVAYSYANKIFTGSGASASARSVSLYGGIGVTYSATPTVDLVALYAGARGNHLTGSSTLLSLGMTFAIV